MYSQMALSSSTMRIRTAGSSGGMVDLLRPGPSARALCGGTFMVGDSYQQHAFVRRSVYSGIRGPRYSGTLTQAMSSGRVGNTFPTTLRTHRMLSVTV